MSLVVFALEVDHINVSSTCGSLLGEDLRCGSSLIKIGIVWVLGTRLL